MVVAGTMRGAGSDGGSDRTLNALVIFDSSFSVFAIAGNSSTVGSSCVTATGTWIAGTAVEDVFFGTTIGEAIGAVAAGAGVSLVFLATAAQEDFGDSSRVADDCMHPPSMDGKSSALITGSVDEGVG